MKAAQIKEYGGTEKIIIQETEIPALMDDKVLVRVHAASLNPFDTMVRSGMLKDNVPLELPFTLGGDIAGTIENIGSGVNNFQVGDKVYGQAQVVAGNSGALAEYAATAGSQVSIMPERLTFTDAASLPLVGVSALQALTEHIGLQPGQKILIHGGSGGIGSIAVQIAKHSGAHVATTVPSDALEFAKSLGADEIIDYQSQDFSELLTGYDAVFDTVGGEVYKKSFGVTKQGGTIVSMTAAVDNDLAEQFKVTALYQSTKVTADRLQKLTQLVEENIVSPLVAEIFSLDQAKEAFDRRESGSVKGKIVVRIV